MSDIPALIAAEAQAQGVDPSGPLGIWRAEGSPDMTAVSPKGALGVMQLMPGTAKDLGVDPRTLQGNIRGGVTYYKQQRDAFGDPVLAAAAYNAGPQAVRDHGGVPPFPETQRYVKKAMAMGQPAGRSGADIFGLDSEPTAAPAANTGTGADIFADAPSQPQPAPTASTPPPAGPAPYKPWTLGLINGILPAAEKMAAFSPAALIPGFRDAELAAIGRMKARAAESEMSGVKPNKSANFIGNLAATGWVPGSPAVSGAATGYLNSTKPDLAGQLSDAGWGAVGGQIGGMLLGLPGKLLRGSTNPSVTTLANAGVPLTVGQAVGGPVQTVEDAATSIPILGDIIKGAKARGMEGVNRAAWNETLGQVGEQLPKDINVGRDAYTYTKGRLGALYDQTLAKIPPLAPDSQFAADLGSIAQSMASLPSDVQRKVQDAIRLKVQPNFQGGMISGDGIKAAQEALGNISRDLMKGDAFSRDGAAVLGNMKTAIETLAARSNPEAAAMLAQINKAYSYFKPLENASASPAAVNGIFPMGTLAQGVAKGRSKATLAAGNAPLQDLSNAAKDVLPSSVPNSGTADRGLVAGLVGLLAGGGHHLPVVGPALAPAGLIGGTSALLYSRPGQQVVTALAKSRGPLAKAIGSSLETLARIGAPIGANALLATRQ